MDDRDSILRSLLDERTVDIVTTGRRTGAERTTEIWTTVVEGQTYICGTPNASKPGVERRPRDWLANLVATPEFVIRLKASVHVDLPATAQRVDDPAERRRVLTAPNTEYYRKAVSLEAAFAHSPLVRVVFTGDAAWLAAAVRTAPPRPEPPRAGIVGSAGVGVRYRGRVSPRLDDRVVLITGAGSGIGRATALLASQQGATIAAVDLDEPALRSTAEIVRSDAGRISTRVADVADGPDLHAAIAALGAETGDIHGVFANAAVLPPPVPAEAIDWQEWDRVLDVNLTGAVRTLISALPHVVDGASFLVSGSSMALRPREARLAYVAAKAGLHAAAKALALEFAPRGIRVNVLAPGLTDTPMVRRIPGHIESGLGSVPLGELVPPSEVAALAVHLLSDAARHVTGAVFSIDGGRSAG